MAVVNISYLFFENLHAGSRLFPDVPEPLVPDLKIFRVNDEDRNVQRRISVQTRCRVDTQRCPDNQQDISLGNDVDGAFYLRDRLSEPYDMRT